MQKRERCFALLCSLFFFGIAFFAPSAHADSFTVTNYDSSGAGSLSTAIDGLNTSGTSGTIEFNESSSSGTIDLSGYTTSLGYDTVFDLNSYNVTLQNYIGGCSGVIKVDGATTGILNIGAGSVWTNSGNLYVAESETGALTISGGSILTNNFAWIGYNADSTGTVNVTGEGSEWDCLGSGYAGLLYIGSRGSGTLNVSDGGSVSANHVYFGSYSGSAGIVNVTGSGSILTSRNALVIGNSGSGTMTVSDGGDVVDVDGYVGQGFAGTATVTGAGSTWTSSGTLYVGLGDTGALTVSDGGTVSCGKFYLSTSSGGSASYEGTAIVTGAGSTLTTNGGLLNIAGTGVGSLTVSEEGSVYSGNMQVGLNTASHPGTITVTGAGSTLASSGYIWIGVNGGSGSINISDGGAVSSSGNIDLAYAGSSSSGTITVAGAGSTLSSGGSIHVGYPGTGILTVSEGGVVNANSGAGTIYLASFSGATGTLNIGEGGAAGTISADAITGGVGTATVNFNHNESDYEFATDLTGTLNVNFNGAGKTILTGIADYTGTTTVNSGTLGIRNDASLGGNVSLAGGSLELEANTLSVGGNYTQAAGSRIDLTVRGSSCGNITVATGDVTVNGGTMNVSVSDYIKNNTVYRVIDAGTGTIAYNTLPSVAVSSATLSFTPSLSEGDLILTANRVNSYNKFATGNAAAAGAALEQAGQDGATGDMLDILNELDNMPDAGDIQNALNTVIPTVDSGILNVSNTSLNQFIGTSSLRLGGLFARARQAEETGISAGDPSLKGLDAWGRGFGEYLKQKPRGFSNGYRATVWGTALGGDIPVFGDKARLGLSGGYAQSDINSKDNSGSTDIDSYQGTFYGGYIDPQNPYYLNGSFSFAYNKYKGKRHVAVGAITSIADSDYDGQQYSVMLDGGYVMNAGKFKVIPLASLQYMRLHLQSYTETGAGALNLSVKAQNYDMLQSGLGMKLERPFEAKGMTVIPELHAKWLYDFIGDRQETTSTFAGGGGSFATNGFDPAQNSLNVGAKLTLASHNNWSIETNYDFEYKEDFTAHTGWADIKYKF